ncbi:hypothetical protein CTI12_AA554650 [Artemisia annua]|uniref:Uncharacterized protein n=1 Tax=Artemisia annua TaxID=35608 RepID=A0A2U1KX30_ARTAN|nr:hypothetical protein CTI12_AA554650 [Artemisia annua]
MDVFVGIYDNTIVDVLVEREDELSVCLSKIRNHNSASLPFLPMLNLARCGWNAVGRAPYGMI